MQVTSYSPVKQDTAPDAAADASLPVPNGVVDTDAQDFSSSAKMTEGAEGSVEERGAWTGQLDFLLSCIGFAVGLGNVWRFPYLCYANGGGAFLIPYIIMLTIAGLPLFFFELALGQFASLGPISIWAKISPLFKGVGIAMVVISALVSVYYNMIIAYTLFYFVMSLNTDVPWRGCDNEWNTKACIVRDASQNMSVPFNVSLDGQNLGSIELGARCNETQLNSTYLSIFQSLGNVTSYLEEQGCNLKAKSPSEEYWENYILGMSSGFEDFGYPRWQLVLALFFTWVIVYLCLFKGVLSSGKVVYFTATFPYVVLVILCIRGATLEGSLEGIKYFVIPQWEKLLEVKVWIAAAVQIFYSLGPAWGGLLTMASYNKFHNNCYRDAILVSVINCGTSVFAGFVIFSMLGFMSLKTGLPVQDVVASGPGLAFVAYPEGIAQMPVAPLWSCLFFFMLFTLGLDSQFVSMETCISAMTDEFPQLRKRKALFALVCCAVCFVLGIPLCCPGGIYLLTLMDWYSGSFSLLVIAFFELVIVMYVYGYKKFLGDVEMMLGFRPNVYWVSNWLVITPIAVLGILVSFGVQYEPAHYGDYVFPAWAENLGFLMILVSAICIPGYMLYEVIRRTGFMQFCQKVSAPEEDWGPADNSHRDGVRYPFLPQAGATVNAGFTSSKPDGIQQLDV